MATERKQVLLVGDTIDEAVSQVASPTLPIGGTMHGKIADLTFKGVGFDTAAPANTVLPSISGTARVGQTLTASNGTWNGKPAPTFGRVWRRNGTAISGATGTTYVLVTADIGATITVTVTATNTEGAVPATSAATAAVTQSPVNTVAPVITGTPTVGQVLSVASETWIGTPTPTTTRAWQRSANGTTGWADIASATGNSYTLAAGDAAQYVRCAVTGTNSAGSAVANSNVIGPIAAA